jgi:hypothetical protein
MSDAGEGPAPHGGGLRRFWNCVLDLGLTLWVLRAPLIATLLGYAILAFAAQAQDLLVDVATGPWWYIVLFLLATFFVWALPTHYASRVLVETDARYQARVRRRGTRFIVWLQGWAPRFLGALTFVAMLVAAWRSWRNVPGVHPDSITGDVKFSLVLLELLIVGALVLYGFYVHFRETIARSMLVVRLESIASDLVEPIARRLPAALALGRHVPGSGVSRSDLGPLFLAFMFVAFTFIPFFFPFTFAEWFPRAIAVPFVFGGWTPIAAYASGVGRHLRVPIISLFLVGAMLLTFLLGDNYAVRRVDPAQHVATLLKVQPPDLDTIKTRPKLNEAIDLWKRANGCAGEGDVCPRPVIIAASGGASRAGFFTASVIGKLLDSRPPQEGGEPLSAEGVRNRLFAISSVSGSSVGTVMTVAALGVADGKQPCKPKSTYLWFGSGQINDWRSCLEVLMSGDFLTPTFAGIVFRDTLRFLGVFGKAGSVFGWADRATLIEQSWEEQFTSAIPGRIAAANGRSCVGSLSCPFVTLRPAVVGDKVNWVPLMFLNGTSVATGQRIVTATIDPWYPAANCPLPQEGPECPVFQETYDFHLLLDGEQPAQGAIATMRRVLNLDAASSDKLFDARLSTAAHNSARFPVVSPPGEVRNRVNNILDRIVDGGYFENFGAQTAIELARAMQAVDGRLAPFILIISNDPEIPLSDALATPDAGEAGLLPDVSAPLDATLNTRSARGTLAVERATTALSETLTAACNRNVAHVRVWPEYLYGNEGPVRPLSFSWWLSKPVQQRLHEQTESEEGNAAPIAAVMAALQSKPPAGCRGDVRRARWYDDPAIMHRKIKK